MDIDDEMDKPKCLKDYAKTCYSKCTSMIYARKIKKRTKVFVPWSESYFLGNPGDYLAARMENPQDIYVIAADIMDKIYEPVKK